jgi:hypothetical protein
MLSLRRNNMRCYNGCPDDELAVILKSRADAIVKAKKLGYGITYFPVEEKYQGYRLSDYMDPTPFCDSAEECLQHIKKEIKGEYHG